MSSFTTFKCQTFCPRTFAKASVNHLLGQHFLSVVDKYILKDSEWVDQENIDGAKNFDES